MFDKRVIRGSNYSHTNVNVVSIFWKITVFLEHYLKRSAYSNCLRSHAFYDEISGKYFVILIFRLFFLILFTSHTQKPPHQNTKNIFKSKNIIVPVESTFRICWSSIRKGESVRCIYGFGNPPDKRILAFLFGFGECPWVIDDLLLENNTYFSSKCFNFR